MPEEITDRLAHSRIDQVAKDVEKHDTAITSIRGDLTAIDKNSEIRHATSQAQNASIIAQNDQILKRLNDPGVVMSILGDPTKIAGLVTLLGAMVAAAAAFGYANAPERPVLVPHLVEPAHDPTPPALPPAGLPPTVPT